MARECARPLLAISLTRILSRSDARSLLSIARLNSAKSRRRPSFWSRILIAQISCGTRGDFWPMSLPLFQAILVFSCLCIEYMFGLLILSEGTRIMAGKWPLSTQNQPPKRIVLVYLGRLLLTQSGHLAHQMIRSEIEINASLAIAESVNTCGGAWEPHSYVFRASKLLFVASSRSLFLMGPCLQ